MEKASSANTPVKHNKRKPLILILAAVLLLAAVLFVFFGLPYIRRHFRTVNIDRSKAAAMVPLETGSRRILTVQFTRVGNTDFDENVDAVSSASLMTDNGTLIGNAELLAEMVQNAVGGDLYAIHTQRHYPSGYGETCNVALKELRGTEEVLLEGSLPDISSYDTVFLIYPIWWGTIPKAVEKFLAECDLSNAVVYTLITHGGSREGQCLSAMRQVTGAEISDQFLTVLDDDADTAKDEVYGWLKRCLAQQ